MIDLYTWPTPNGHKLHIALEEMGLAYTVHAVNIRTGEQFQPEFLAISPNNRIPALVDTDGPDGKPISLFESGAMLIYLAEKSGKLLPKAARERYATLQWLMWQMGGVGPMFGQANHFRAYAKDPQPYPIERYTNESNRLARVLDKQLAQHAFVTGNDYTIADIAIFPWIRGSEKRGVDIATYPNLQRWFDTINARPAVERALKVLADAVNPPIDDKQRDIMFGAAQFAQR
ncbi:MAG: glutathione S-transferase N-terminal domain-containing protein [Proteobacteria bacterium]|nr:glutathione S-transferase N-terminal domain-containing protein [Burkholderiales bacterium]